MTRFTYLHLLTFQLFMTSLATHATPIYSSTFTDSGDLVTEVRNYGSHTET